ERFDGELPDPETPQVTFTVVEGERAGERWVSDDGEVTRTQLLERDGERVFADARARFATPERIPSADELLVAWPEEVLQQFEPDDRTAVVVLTHEDRWDVPALAGALAGDAFYIGALG